MEEEKRIQDELKRERERKEQEEKKKLAEIEREAQAKRDAEALARGLDEMALRRSVIATSIYKAEVIKEKQKKEEV